MHLLTMDCDTTSAPHGSWKVFKDGNPKGEDSGLQKGIKDSVVVDFRKGVILKTKAVSG